jgi:hypothetical protein
MKKIHIRRWPDHGCLDISVKLELKNDIKLALVSCAFVDMVEDLFGTMMRAHLSALAELSDIVELEEQLKRVAGVEVENEMEKSELGF